jgi:hypothetical protein
MREQLESEQALRLSQNREMEALQRRQVQVHTALAEATSEVAQLQRALEQARIAHARNETRLQDDLETSMVRYPLSYKPCETLA